MPAPRVDDAIAAHINAQLNNRVQSQTPTPGSEEALRGLIAGIASGEPDYSSMSPELAKLTREQLDHLQTGIKSMGEIKSITFRGVGNQGWDMYAVQHEKGMVDWRILLSESGLITGAVVHAGP